MALITNEMNCSGRFRIATALLLAGLTLNLTALSAQERTQPQAPPTPTDVKPGSINMEDVPYPYPVSYLPMTLYGQDVRMAYMDVPAEGQANGRTVVLFHGMNFFGEYWAATIDVSASRAFELLFRIKSDSGAHRSPSSLITFMTWR